MNWCTVQTYDLKYSPNDLLDEPCIIKANLLFVNAERRSQTHQLESLFNFYLRLLWKHRSQSELANIWKFVVQGLQIYPFSSKLYNAIVQIGHLHTSPSKLRWIIDDYLHKLRHTASLFNDIFAIYVANLFYLCYIIIELIVS